MRPNKSLQQTAALKVSPNARQFSRTTAFRKGLVG
jgi:hypothetical protein